MRAGDPPQRRDRELPSAMQSTKTATTIAKVKWEAPSERAPIRFRVVWMHIIAKPESRTTTA
jgi:hypothetical protein